MMAFLKFVLFSAVMFGILMYAWDLPPIVPARFEWIVHFVYVLVLYAMGAVVWLITRIFVRTPALLMSTVFAFGFLGLSFIGKAYLDSLGLVDAAYRRVPSAAAPRPAGEAQPAPPPQPAADKTQGANRAQHASGSTSAPACQRHEDRDRNHVTITCR